MALSEVAEKLSRQDESANDGRTARAPAGVVVYAIGDIHGCDELLAALLGELSADARTCEPGLRHDLIFLGDYIDRGPESRRTVDHVLAAAANPLWNVTALKGNHEDALLRFLDDPSRWPVWADFGARSTLLSYGVPPPLPDDGPGAWAEARDRLAAAMPPDHIEWMRGLELSAERGDYFFVHAGVRPRVPLSCQTERDLLWIREDFMQHTSPFEKVIVHGHTPAETVIGEGRIALDTAAYASGALTAIRLKDADRRLFQVHGAPDPSAVWPKARTSGKARPHVLDRIAGWFGPGR